MKNSFMVLAVVFVSSFIVTSYANYTDASGSYVKSVIAKKYINSAAKRPEHMHQSVLVPGKATISLYLNKKRVKYVGSKVSDIPSSVQLGMNGLAPLDQGEWGSCVTFATTAALDAYFKLIDDNSQISQTCTMQLARTVGDPNQVDDGGWEGAESAKPVLQEIQQYGEWPKIYLKQIGCGHLFSYPKYSSYGNGVAMSVNEYTPYSINLFNGKTLYKELPSSQSDDVVTEIKHALAAGDRVVVQVRILEKIGSGDDVASYGSYNGVANDTWMFNTDYLMPLWENQSLMLGLHEMVITGYDDNAVVTGVAPNGQTYTQKGVFTLRNSYGPNAKMIGSNDDANGNHYMTYDYANAGSSGFNKQLPVWVQNIYEIGQ